MCVAANKIKGARAAVITDAITAREAVEDVDLNVICLGQGHLDVKAAQKIITTFLSAKLSKARRHRRRINKIAKLEL
jgi:ribose 5-phosphate isomerase B